MKLGRDFTSLWFGQSISLFGNAVTQLAFPTVAILTLHAAPLQVGILSALQFAAFPILGLPVGVWSDRYPRRPIMIAANVVRALVLASVLVATFAHVLAFAELAIAAAILGIASVFFEICYQTYVPSIVEREQLGAANSRLEFTRSIAQIGGSGFAGPLIAAVGATLALGVDAITYVVSTLSLLAIRARESRMTTHATEMRPSFIADLREGVELVARSRVLRSIAACTATLNFGSSMSGAIFLVFAYRRLHLTPAVLGIVLAAAEFGFAGALLATRVRRRTGLGGALFVSSLASGLAAFLIPLAIFGPPAVTVFVAELVVSFVTPIYNINQITLRQSIVPLELQGRMNATMRTIVWGTLPLGALVGGILGNAAGTVATLVIAAGVQTLASLWIALGPVMRLRDIESAAIA